MRVAEVLSVVSCVLLCATGIVHTVAVAARLLLCPSLRVRAVRKPTSRPPPLGLLCVDPVHAPSPHTGKYTDEA